MYQANLTSLELLKQLKEAELEVESLKVYIIDMKQRFQIYIPAKDDQIDIALADYINNYPDRRRLKVMFIRDTVGIYQFGTKKVFVQVEQGRLSIRVGGGFISIDEFLDQYTAVELER